MGHMDSGHYPPGTENDPRAPWNAWDDEDEDREHDPHCALNSAFNRYRRCDCGLSGEDDW